MIRYLLILVPTIILCAISFVIVPFAAITYINKPIETVRIKTWCPWFKIEGSEQPVCINIKDLYKR